MRWPSSVRWAHGAPRDDSDVDVVLLTDSPESCTHRDDWLPEVGGVGLEIDVGIGTPAWASVDPLDDGTRRVASDGMRILHDPDRLLRRPARRLRVDSVR